MSIRWWFKHAETGCDTGQEPAPSRDQSETLSGPTPRPAKFPKHPAAVGEFVDWLIQAGEVDHLSRRRLWCLYHEFCEYSETPHLTELQLLRRIRAAGIERYREPTGKRRWLYRVRTADVFHLNRVANSQ